MEMGTAWIFQALLLTGAIISTQSYPTEDLDSGPSRRPLAKIKNSWRPVSRDTPTTLNYDQTETSFTTTILPSSTLRSRRAPIIVHDNHKYYDGSHPRGYTPHPTPTASTSAWSIQGSPPNLESVTIEIPNTRFSRTNAFTITTRPSKYADSAEAGTTTTANFEYPNRYNPETAASNGVTQNALPTFSTSLETNLGTFKPFPPFSRSTFGFGELNPGGQDASENFMGPNVPMGYPVNGGQPPQLSFGYNRYGIARPGSVYYPLSGQSQLHFQPSQHPRVPNSFITLGGAGGNQIDPNQSGGAEMTSAEEGSNAFIPENFGDVNAASFGSAFNIQSSNAFNDYDKTFGKYSAGAPALTTKEPTSEQNEQGSDEDREGSDKTNAEYRSEESSNSREQYKDEEETEGGYKERRGVSKKREEEFLDSTERCGKGGFFGRKEKAPSHESHESQSHHKAPIPSTKSVFGRKTSRRRPSHESESEVTTRKHGTSHRSKDGRNQANRKNPQDA